MEGQVWKKLPFLLIFCISLGIFTRQAIVCIERFLAKDTRISLENVKSSQAEFPSLTICPDYNVAYKQEFLEKYNVSPSDMRSFKFPQTKDMSAADFFLSATYEIHDVINDMMVATMELAPGTEAFEFYFSHKTKDELPPLKNHQMLFNFSWYSWSTIYYKTFGRCYSFELPDLIKAARVTDVTINFNMRSVVYLHHPDQFFSVDVDTKAKAELGQKLFLDTKHDLTKHMPKLIKKNDTEILTCNEQMNHGYDTCFLEYVDENMKKDFNCTATSYTVGLNNDTCALGDFDEDKNKHFNQLFEDAYSGARLNCPSPCSTMSNIFGYPILDTHAEDKAFIKLYFKSFINVRRNVLAYDSTSLLAEVGGYVGLLLGLSLLDVAKVIRRVFSKTGFKPFEKRPRMK